MITPESQSSTQIHQDDTSSTGSALALIKFPVRLFELLEAADTNPSLASIISWTSDGCGFRVRCHKSFERRILPGIFPSMKAFASFRRQLNLYGIRKGAPGDPYSHPLLQRNRKDLVCEMRRPSKALTRCPRAPRQVTTESSGSRKITSSDRGHSTMTVPGGDLSVVGMNPSSSEMNGYHTRDFPFSVSQAALQQGAPGSCSVSHDDDEALLHQKVPSTRISSSLLPCFGNALGTEAVSSFVNQSDINQEIIKTFLWL